MPPETAVTLPALDLLAQAPHVSPWYGRAEEDWQEIGGVPTRALDELDALDRVMMMLRTPRCSAIQLRVLAAVARHGWCVRWTAQGLQSAAGLRPASVSKALAGLEDKALVRVDRTFYGHGARDFPHHHIGRRHIPSLPAHDGNRTFPTGKCGRPNR